MRRLAALFLLVLLGCGETNIQAIHRLRNRGYDMRHRLHRIAETLPPPGSFRYGVFPVGLSPPPMYVEDELDRVSANTEIIMIEHLRDPDASLWGSADLVDPILSGDLHRCLAWTGPKNPLHPDVRGNRGDLGPECERAFAFPYLVILRTLSASIPEGVVMEVILFDLRRDAPLGAALVKVRSGVSTEDLGRGEFAEAAKQKVRSDLFVKLRRALNGALATIPGAKFDFR